jgi:hypothetical protein
MSLVEHRESMGIGLGCIDVHLPASAMFGDIPVGPETAL